VPERYARQALFPGIGPEGQARLARARVAVVGCGALGCAIADHLVRAGLGYVRLIDRDFVELTNLHRQVLFDEQDAGQGLPKAVAAARRLGQVNSEIQVEPLVADLNVDTVARLLGQVDLVMDGTDNFETRYLVNEHCVQRNLPWVYCAAVASYGVVMPVVPRVTACLSCLFPGSPPPGSMDTCETAGVISPIIAVAAGLAASEALKLLVGAEEQLSRGLTWVDVWHNTLQRTPLVGPVADCAVCQRGHYDHMRATRGSTATSLCGRNAVQVRPRNEQVLDLDALASRLETVCTVARTPYFLRLAFGAYEVTLFPDARAIIKGTDDPALAKSLYARYVGL
jgi:adenylyltransferase/sulfurtransferase